jgi:hypothetical protein
MRAFNAPIFAVSSSMLQPVKRFFQLRNSQRVLPAVEFR